MTSNLNHNTTDNNLNYDSVTNSALLSSNGIVAPQTLNYNTSVFYSVGPNPSALVPFACGNSLPITNFLLDSSSANYSISFWFSVPDVSQRNVLFSQSDFVSTTGSFNITISDTSSTSGKITLGNGATTSNTPTDNQSVITNNTLYNVTFVCSNNGLNGTLYLNGKQIGAIDKQSAGYGSKLRLGIGNVSYDTLQTQYFPGYMQQVMYFKNYILSANQAAILYQTSLGYSLAQSTRILPLGLELKADFLNQDTLPVTYSTFTDSTNSIFCWFYLTDISNSVNLISQNNSTDSSKLFRVYVSAPNTSTPSTLYLEDSNINNPLLDTTREIAVNTLYNLAFVCSKSLSGTGYTGYLYLNGVLVGQKNMPNSNYPAKATTTIGSGAFPGYIERLMYGCSSAELSDQVLSLYTEMYNNLNTRSKNVPVLNTWNYTNKPKNIFDSSTYIMSKGNTDFLTLPYEDINNSLKFRCIRLTSSAVEQIERELILGGIDELFDLQTQQAAEIPFSGLSPNMNYFNSSFLPSNVIDFSNTPFSQYYWELFFYIPFQIARELRIQQQFESSRQWIEYIFNPTIRSVDYDLVSGEDANDKYWRFIMLRSKYNPTLYHELHEDWATEFTEDTLDNLQLSKYHDDPFDPHALARLRPIAYQKSILMHYINNLVDWADNLYTQYTTESINEATMLYIEAYDLLGKKPINLGKCELPQDQNFTQIKSYFVGNNIKIPEFIINLEQQQSVVSNLLTSINPINNLPHAYFGLPENSQFIAYWNKVIGRLYNIRHALTIDGIFEQVALFAPEINPLELIKQVASGTSLSKAMQELQAAVPYYRFRVILARAKELAQLAIQFGGSLLAALEKQDSEQLSRIYNINQQTILALTRISKDNQLFEIGENINSLQASLANAQYKFNYYSGLIEEGLSSGERAQLALAGAALVPQIIANDIRAGAVIAHLMPEIFGLAGGGMQFGSAVSEAASVVSGIGSILNESSSLSATVASFGRRAQEWELSKITSQNEVDQINKQILAAQYQQIVAQNEITLLQENIKQEQKVEQFLLSKFTCQELYQWLSSKLAGLYFQVYQLAYKAAKQAEEAWKFEKAVTLPQSMIKGGYWDSLYRGLLAGEALMLDIHQMEQAYMDQDRRRLEIQKTISLAQLANDPNLSDNDPNKKALGNLKLHGTCNFNLTQEMFDQDYGQGKGQHYSRQIKTLTVSFPGLLGPYQNICATLQQTAGVIYDVSGNKNSCATNQQIAISQGLNDSGMLSLNVNDDRYLPFEGTGAVSNWILKVNNVETVDLTDVIIQLSYTALPGGTAPAPTASTSSFKKKLMLTVQ